MISKKSGVLIKNCIMKNISLKKVDLSSTEVSMEDINTINEQCGLNKKIETSIL
jgi:hypothetical protein